MAFGQNTKLGCVVHECTQYQEYFVFCHYEKNAYAKNAEGQDQEVCEPGPPCDRHLTCTTYPCSFCDTRTTPIPCEDITKLIDIDAATNATILTTAINDAYNTWSRSDKSNFNAYKMRIENIVWSAEFPTPDAKMDEILTVLTGYAPDGSAQQQLLYSVVIPGFGTIADLVACPRTTTPTTTAATTTTATTTTTVPPTTTTVGGCAVRASLIAIDPASNTTVLTTAINNAFATWSRTDKANFNAYKKRIEDIIFTNNEFPTLETKLQAITDVLKGYAPDGSAQQQLVYAVQIASWGTIADFVACGTTAPGK
ncbi:hypothetical protein AAVH_25439 [Aphelenchoides avenae]|nr:hypothetical protein AAVH_25439 [Aphelenchus avenae]